MTYRGPNGRVHILGVRIADLNPNSLDAEKAICDKINYWDKPVNIVAYKFPPPPPRKSFFRTLFEALARLF